MEDRIQLTDPSTGLSTRGAFEHLFGFAFSLGDRGVPPTLVFFKPDRESGLEDSALDELGRALKRVTRRTDVVARYEPNEFVCLLVDCNRSGAVVASDRIRAAMTQTLARIDTTLSGGVATYHADMDEPAQMVEAGRRALERARESGGDRTEIASAT